MSKKKDISKDIKNLISEIKIAGEKTHSSRNKKAVSELNSGLKKLRKILNEKV